MFLGQTSWQCIGSALKPTGMKNLFLDRYVTVQLLHLNIARITSALSLLNEGLLLELSFIEVHKSSQEALNGYVILIETAGGLPDELEQKQKLF